MKTFSEKIKEKRIIDLEKFQHASKSVYQSLQQEKYKRRDMQENECAVELRYISEFLGFKEIDFSMDLEDAEAHMQFLMNETGIMRRKVVLTGKWWKNGATPLLCSDKEGRAHALIPDTHGGYIYYNEKKVVPVNKKNQSQFEAVCYCFYQPFENSSISLKSFIYFLFQSFRMTDIIWLLSLSLGVGLLGMIMPKINQFIFHSVIPSGTAKELFGISVLIVGSVLMLALCKLARAMWVIRIGNKMELLAQNAVWARVLSLPVDFFKEYSSGELTERVSAVDTICGIIGGQMVATLLNSVFSFVYLFQIGSISPALLLPSFVIVICIVVVNMGTAFIQIRQTAHNSIIESKLSGMVFQFLDGITKIKLAGAEVRAFEKWAELYSQLKLMSPKGLLFSSGITELISYGGTIVLYICAYRAKMSVSDYIAFHTVFGYFVTAVLAMTGISSQLASLKPSLEMLKPILEKETENTGYRKQVSSLLGEIELNQVKFRYNEKMPYVLNELDLHIKSGEYLGIVGSSGCGKSTLMRVLLGFEKPQSGSVYYDMQDMNNLDVRSIRRRIGVVLQNGKLFSGDIYSNIVIGAPWLTVDEAWEAAEKSGFAEDIEKMPMGMFTMISEGGGGLSGGQQQRLLIARALAADPDIVMFDEATSALDNITQEMVVHTLEEMKCTRLVIAHRLSTIRNCSRIIYMDKGKIIESGTYEELMQLGGKFAELAERQLV